MRGASVYKKQVDRPLLTALMPHLAYDKERSVYLLNDGYVGFGFFSKPLSGVDDTVMQRLNVFLTFDYPEGTFIQIMLLASPDIRERIDSIKRIRGKNVSTSLDKSVDNRVKRNRLSPCYASMPSRA